MPLQAGGGAAEGRRGGHLRRVRPPREVRQGVKDRGLVRLREALPRPTGGEEARRDASAYGVSGKCASILWNFSKMRKYFKKFQ